MSQSYQNLASDQICKVQNDKKLISFHDRLRAALPGSYAQIHAKGEFSENNHKVHSLIGVSIQDYSNGTGERNIITRFHLSPEQVQFFLTRLTAGFQEFEWSISKIFGEPDQYGYSTAQQFSISRHAIRRQGNEEPVADPDHKRKGDQSTESKRRLLYAVGQLPDGQICLYPAHGHGSLPALKAGGCLCDRVGALHCPAADLKRERDARKSAGPAPADAAAALPIRSIENTIQPCRKGSGSPASFSVPT